MKIKTVATKRKLLPGMGMTIMLPAHFILY